MDNQYLTAVVQFEGVFSPDECRWISLLPLPAADADVYDDGQAAGSRVDPCLRRTRERVVPRSREFAWLFRRLGRLAREAHEKTWGFRLDDRATAHVLEYGAEGFFDRHMDLGRGPTASSRQEVIIH